MTLYIWLKRPLENNRYCDGSNPTKRDQSKHFTPTHRNPDKVELKDEQQALLSRSNDPFPVDIPYTRPCTLPYCVRAYNPPIKETPDTAC